MKNPPDFFAFGGVVALTLWVIVVWILVLIVTPIVWIFDRLCEVVRGR